MRHFPIFIAIMIAAVFQAKAGQQDQTAEMMSNLEQWVETKRIFSRESADWKLEREMLKETEAMLKNEVSRLDELLRELEESTSGADEARASLHASKERETASAAIVETALGELESRLKNSLIRFPEPLLAQIQPLMRRIPEDPANTRQSIGERLQNVVGIMGEAAKFNNTLTLTSEVREFSDGRPVEVRTLYWGLAAAYFVDAGETMGGVGYPSANGWEWPRRDESARAISSLISIYEGTGSIRFIQLPASVQN